MIKEYEDEIAEAYKGIETSLNLDIASPENWDVQACVDFVRQVVQKVLGQEVGDEKDIFLSGADRYVLETLYNRFEKQLQFSC